MALRGAEMDTTVLGSRGSHREWGCEGGTNTPWFLLWPLSKLHVKVEAGCPERHPFAQTWSAEGRQRLICTGAASLMFTMPSALLCFMYPSSVLFVPCVPVLIFASLTPAWPLLGLPAFQRRAWASQPPA